MRPAPRGTEVGLYYDSSNPVQVDDFLQTQSGRTYLITSVRIQEQGKHIGRQHLRALVSGPEEIGPEDKVHLILWYSRSAPSGMTRPRRGRLVSTLSISLGWFALFLGGAYYAVTYVWIST